MIVVFNREIKSVRNSLANFDDLKLYSHYTIDKRDYSVCGTEKKCHPDLGQVAKKGGMKTVKWKETTFKKTEWSNNNVHLFCDCAKYHT